MTKTTEVYRHYAPDPTGAAALIERAFAPRRSGHQFGHQFARK